MPLVSDSTIWRDDAGFAKSNHVDTRMRIGIVRSSEYSEEFGDNVYVVEVQADGDKLFIPCRYLRSHSGAFNYEDYVLQTYKYDNKNDAIPAFETKAGDMVVVAYLNGDAREGVILGGLNHLSRKTKLKPADGPQYFKTFNGVETDINKDGELKTTFRGIPTNAAVLKASPKDKLPAPTYNDSVGTTYYKFDKDGGWTVGDNATSLKQSIYINKKDGKIVVTSGNIILTMDKNPESTTLVTKTLTINAADKMTTNTKEWSTYATTAARIKSPKVAFGTDGVELLDQIIKLIEAVGKVTPISPVGPCAPMMSAPQWPGVDQVKSAVNSIKGTL